MATKPRRLTEIRNIRAWGDYCRYNGMKNRGKGRATIIGPRYTTRGEVQLQSDGSIQGLPDDIDPPDAFLREMLAEAYPALMEQRLPDPSANIRIHGMPEPTEFPNIARRTYFTYPSPEGADHASMIVERLDFNDPDENPKRCIPWVFFPDTQKWEHEVPDGWDKPLYGEPFGGYRYMLHEGEKACDAARAAAQANSGHPWQRFLSQFQHVSWQGGAFPASVEYTDWSTLNRSDVTIYIMPDNDEEGYKVARRLRKVLRRVKGMYCVHWSSFDKLVPKSWDIADPVPMTARGLPVDQITLEGAFSLWEDAGEWKRMILPTGKEKTVYDVRPEFAKKFGYIATTDEWVELNRPFLRFKTPTLNMWGLPLSEGHLTNLSASIRATGHTKTFHRSGYKPGGTIVDSQWVAPPRAWQEGSTTILNIYTPTEIEELEAKANDAVLNPKVADNLRPWRETDKTLRPFLLYLRHLIPDITERKTLIRWACNNLTTVSPDDRLPWATLLCGPEQGTGKTTLGRILSMLVGSANSISVNGSNLNDEFTGWMEGKQLISIEEMKDDSGFKMYDRLKDPISNSPITVRRMYVEPYPVESHITLLAMSNHLSALSLPNTGEDRRWYFPKVTTRLNPEECIHNQVRRYMNQDPNHYGLFSGLWIWLKKEKGLRYLLWWLRRYGWKLHTQPMDWSYRGGKKTLFREAYNRSPNTEVKEQVSKRSTPEWEDALDLVIDPEEHPILILEDVMEYLSQTLKRGVPRPSLVQQWLERNGYVMTYGTETKRRSLFQGGGLTAKVKGRVLRHNALRSSEDWVGDRLSVRWLSDKYKILMAAWKPTGGRAGDAAGMDQVFSPETSTDDLPF